MLPMIIANGEAELFQFPGLSWWILHVVAIVVIFTVGCLYGQKRAAKVAPKPAETPES